LAVIIKEKETRSSDGSQKSAQNIKIKINPEYEKLVPELSENDFQLLRASIKADNAVHTPIFVNYESIILDGLHRWRIVEELGIGAYETTVKHFDDPLLEKNFLLMLM
jgi:ParB-like chromosome segregation protein Spo0J